MPLDQNVLDEILNLMAQQVLTELRTAAAEGKTMDPRKIKNAMDLLERADARAFKAKEPAVVPKSSHSEDAASSGAVAVVPQDQPLWRTKVGRDMLRHMFLTPATRALLTQFDAEDNSTTPLANEREQTS